MQDVQVRSVVCSLAGVHASREEIADSRGWQEFLQLLSLTEMFMYIGSASGFYLLSFPRNYAGHSLLYAWQLLVNM